MKVISILKKLDRDTPAEVYYAGEYVRDLIRRKRSNKVEIVVKNIQLLNIVKYIRRYTKNLKIRKLKECISFSDDNLDVTIRNPQKGDRYSPYHTLKEDARERVFTIDSMYLPIHSKGRKGTIDVYHGRNDIRERKIKTVIKADSAIKRNPEIMTNSLALAAELNYRMDTNLFYAIKSNHRLIEGVSIQKIRDDFVEILMSSRPSRYLRIMHKSGLMHVIIPELSVCDGVTQNKKYHKYDVFTHSITACDSTEPNLKLRLAALFHDIGKPQAREEIVKDGQPRVTFYNHEVVGSKTARRILRRLKFGKEMAANVSNLIYNHMYNYEPGKWSNAAVRRFITKAHIVPNDLEDLENLPVFLLRKADRAANGLNLSEISPRQKSFEKRIRYVYDKSQALHIGDLDIDGGVLMEEFKLTAGPTVGHILKYLLSVVIEDQSVNHQDILIEEASKYLSNALK